MAINDVVHFRPISSTSGKRNLKLTNCQVIECLTNSPNVRYQSRSVSWNKTGSLLAVGCSDASIRLWNPLQQSELSSISSVCKDVGSITGQNGPIIAATFHPISDHLLCTSAAGVVRLWDVRGNTQMISSTSIVTTAASAATSSSPYIVSVEWNPIHAHIVAVTTHDGSVFIYDTRNLSSSASTTSASKGVTSNNTSTSALIRQFQFELNDRIESCVFDRATGRYIMAGVTNREHYSGMGCIKICAWDIDNDVSMDIDSNDSQNRNWYVYPAHAGPIYTIAANSNGTQLATGGADAVVGVWDVPTMVCCTAVSSRTKYIRSLSFSPDDQILAVGTEEDVIELLDCTSASSTTRIGLASLANSGRPSSMHRTAGTEDIAFHPTSQYLLACSRTSESSPVSLVKVTIS